MESGDGKTNVYPIYAKSILLEHDYSGNLISNNDNNNSNESKAKNVLLGKKFGSGKRAFDAVDKWADSVTLRVPIGDDKKKIVDREITIHKVKYPFLPEQQIRGKVYKKFGIPAVMGGALSGFEEQLTCGSFSSETYGKLSYIMDPPRAFLNLVTGLSMFYPMFAVRAMNFGQPPCRGFLLGGSSPKEHPKSRRKRDSKRMTDLGKTMVSPEELTERSQDKWYLAEPINQSYFSQISDETNDDKSEIVDIINRVSGKLLIESDLTVHQCAAATSVELTNSEKSVTTLETSTTNCDLRGTLTTNFGVPNSPEIVSPLKLDELSNDRDFYLPQFRRILNSSSTVGVPTTNKPRKRLTSSLQLEDSEAQGPTLRDTISINSQITQRSSVLEVPKPRAIVKRTKPSIVPVVTNIPASSLKSSRPHHPLNLDEMPTQMYKSVVKKDSDRRDLNGNSIARSGGHVTTTTTTTTTTKPRGLKRKIEEKSRPTSSSNNLERTEDAMSIKQLSKIWESSEEIIELSPPVFDSSLVSKITIGTSVNSSPRSFRPEDSTPDSVILDHSYSEVKNKIARRFVTRHFLDSDDEDCPSEEVVKNVARARPKGFLEENSRDLKNRESERRTVVREDWEDKENKYAVDLSRTGKRESGTGRLPLKNLSESPSPVRKKRRIYCPRTETISPELRVVKTNEKSRSSARCKANSTPELIDITDDPEIPESRVDLPADPDIKILPAKFIPWSADMPLFVVVDSLSNKCSEYDQDLAKISRLCEYASNFSRETEENPRIGPNESAESFEMTETVEGILTSLESDGGGNLSVQR